MPDAPRPRDVLVAEDLPETVSGLFRDLKLRGANPHRVGTRVGAEMELRESPFVAVLIDLSLPAREGDAASAGEGVLLVKQILGGAYGPHLDQTQVYIITAQSIDAKGIDLDDHERFGGVFSKLADSRWLLKDMALQGIVDEAVDLDLEGEEPFRARVHVMAEEVIAGTSVVLDPIDLEFEKVQVPLTDLPPSVRTRLLRGELPILLWAQANITAETSLDLDLDDYAVAEQQVDPDRDYEDISWLK